MQDDKGLYYFPFPANPKAKMYVRKAEGTIWFRLWSADDPQLWEQHGWVPYTAIKMARNMYTGKNFDPRAAYDINVARALLEESNSAAE
jgi:hypothetical protein